MALAEKVLAAQFNKPDLNIIDHYTYAFVGDGCLMEGISHEVSSFAGTQGLGKLIVFWDDNSISIDGHTDGWFTEDVAKRFDAYNWHVVSDVDGHNPESVRDAIKQAQSVNDKPTIICCKTIIGFGAPTKNNTSGSHGSPLGDEEIAVMRSDLKWEYDPFVIPEDIYGPAGYIDDIYVCCHVLNDLKDKFTMKKLSEMWEGEEDFEKVLEISFRESKKELEEKNLLNEVLKVSSLVKENE